VGLTFYYDEQEVAQTLCRTKKLYYVSTGGGILKKQFGFEYVKALVGEFFHIFDVQGFFAEKLDLLESNPEAIMEAALHAVSAQFA
jgi:FMN-dependent NADH-azoreductase